MNRFYVFVIRSPYCFVNAMELRYELQLSPHQCILLIGYRESNDINIEHINRMYHAEEWVSKNYFPYNMESFILDNTSEDNNNSSKQKNRYLLYWRYVRCLNGILPDKDMVDSVVVQNTVDYSFIHIANSLSPKRVYCLDEGTRSAWKTNVSKIKKAISAKNTLEYTKRKLLKNLYNFNINRLSNITYFSCYDIEIEEGDELIKNTYQQLRSKIEKLPSNDKLILFIGSSLSEVGVIDEKFYLKYLKKIKAYYSDYQIHYIAHRADNKEKLDKIQHDLGIDIIKYKLPFEMQIAEIGPVPRCIASFYSSVLINCYQMFNPKVETVSFELPREQINTRHREKIDAIYSYFKSKQSANFRVVEFESI